MAGSNTPLQLTTVDKGHFSRNGGLGRAQNRIVNSERCTEQSGTPVFSPNPSPFVTPYRENIPNEQVTQNIPASDFENTCYSQVFKTIALRDVSGCVSNTQNNDHVGPVCRRRQNILPRMNNILPDFPAIMPESAVEDEPKDHGFMRRRPNEVQTDVTSEEAISIHDKYAQAVLRSVESQNDSGVPNTSSVHDEYALNVLNRQSDYGSK